MPTLQYLKRRGRFITAEFDDGETIRCTRELVRRARLSPGQLIDEVFVDRLRDSAARDLARSEAERHSRDGSRNRSQIFARLTADGIATSHARQALDELVAEALLDDRELARQVARQQIDRALRRDADVSEFDLLRSLMRRLTMRGFTSEDAAGAVRDAWSEFADLHAERLAQSPEGS